MRVRLHYRAHACRCALPVLYAASSDVHDGTLVWCPGCDTYELCEGAFCDLFWPPRTMYDGTEFHRKPPGGGVRYRGHVNRDGSVTFEIDEATGATMTPYEVTQMADSATFLAMQARVRRAHLAGTDRYTFARAGDFYVARFMNRQIRLATYRAGVRKTNRGPMVCVACRGNIDPGVMAYRYDEPASGDARFCATCVETPAPLPSERPALRVITGGKGSSKS